MTCLLNFKNWKNHFFKSKKKILVYNFTNKQFAKISNKIWERKHKNMEEKERSGNYCRDWGGIKKEEIISS